MLDVNKYMYIFTIFVRGIGIINAISTSKIIKIIAIKKNWIENGVLYIEIGFIPHSIGEDFSFSFSLVFDIKRQRSIILEVIITIKVIRKKSKLITFLILLTFWLEVKYT